MKSLLSISLWFFTVCLYGAGTPLWVATSGADSNLDPKLYLSGYGVSPVEGKNTTGAQQSAKDQALKDLGQRLKVNVDATSRITDSSVGTKSFSSYQSDVKAMVNLDLSGVENYETAFDASQNRWVALAVLSKVKMSSNLELKRSQQIAQLESDLTEVKALAERKRIDLLQKALQVLDKDLDLLVENVALARQLGSPLDAQVLQKYYAAKDELRGNLLAQKILTFKDLVATLEKAFPWKDLEGFKVVLIPAVYKTTDISGEFFYNLREDLADSLALHFKSIIQIQATPDTSPDFILKGSYYEAGDGWHVVFKLSDMKKKELVATWDTELDAAFVSQQKFTFLPANINIATLDHDLQIAIYDNPVKTELTVWTNKGNEGLVFEDGEYVDFSLQVNRPGYISVLYHLAGLERRRTPLLQNLRIFPKDLNKPYKLERMGPFTPPYGSEAVQVFFSPEPIAPYITTEVTIDGYLFPVLAEDYDNFLVKTRGLGGLAKGKLDNQAQLRTDSSLSLTIVPKRKK